MIVGMMNDEGTAIYWYDVPAAQIENIRPAGDGRLALGETVDYSSAYYYRRDPATYDGPPYGNFRGYDNFGGYSNVSGYNNSYSGYHNTYGYNRYGGYGGSRGYGRGGGYGNFSGFNGPSGLSKPVSRHSHHHRF